MGLQQAQRILGMLLMLACTALGSRSLVLTSSQSGGFIQGSFPNNSAYAALTSWRVEGQFDSLAPLAASAGIWEVDSTASIVIDASHNLVVRGYNGSEGAAVALGISTAVRFRAQRDTASGKFILETWDMGTGTYTRGEGDIQVPGTKDFRGIRFSIGSFYEPVNPNLHVGFIRWFSSSVAAGGAPPALTAGAGNLLNYEFENNLTDSSSHHVGLSLMSGSPSYATTTVFPPSPLITAPPVSSRAGDPISLDGQASFSNVDSPAISCIWQIEGPQKGTLIAPSSCNSFFTPTISGEYSVKLQVTDVNGTKATRSFQIAAVATDENGIVIVPDARINAVLGPLIASVRNPWGWKYNRDIAVGNLWVSRMESYFPLLAQTPGTGTVTATGAPTSSTTLTVTGGNPQTQFCGGGTSPVMNTSKIAVWYPSTDYPGEYGRAFYDVTGCPSPTTLTLSVGWSHTMGTTSGMQFSVIDPFDPSYFNYTIINIPGNYYDNVLALYSLYYSTGIETYRDTARTLANHWWRSPNWDLGSSLDTSAHGGTFIAAGPARGQAVTGLILWWMEDPSAPNIWPGLHHLWDWWMYVANSTIASGQLGDAREMGYVTAGMALCARFDTDATYRANCAAELDNIVDNLWVALETTAPGGGGHWRQTVVNRAAFAGSTVSVHVVDGSPNVTLTGATWASGTFDDCYGDGALKNCRLWFTNDHNQVTLPGNNTAAVADTVDYLVSAVGSSTTLTLTTNYNSGACPGPSGCEKGLMVGSYVGFGMLPYMLGMAMGSLGTYTYDYYVSVGDLARAETIKLMVRDGVRWISTTGYDNSNHVLWGSVDFIHCNATAAANDPCAGDVSLNGEAMRGFSADYILNHDPVVLAAGDEVYHYTWGKPGFDAPYPKSTSSYLSALDDGGYMLVPSGQANKWLGFFWGYGFGNSWPAARVGGLATPATQVIFMPVDFTVFPGAVRVRITVTEPTGQVTSTTCDASPCMFTVDARSGNKQITVDYLSASGEIISLGERSPLPRRR